MQQALFSAVEGLFDTFARYPLREWTDPCLHCCNDREEEEALHRYGLRELPEEVLRPYASNAGTTWGDAQDFRHFLPRMFDVLASGGFDYDWPDLAVMFSRLRYLHWSEWPEAEQSAVTTYLRALWATYLAGELPGEQSPGEVICAIGQAIDQLEPYLTEWRDAMPERGAVLFAHLVIWERDGVSRQLDDAWWRDREDQRVQVERWMADPVTISAVAMARGDDENVALALQVLRP